MQYDKQDLLEYNQHSKRLQSQWFKSIVIQRTGSTTQNQNWYVVAPSENLQRRTSNPARYLAGYPMHTECCY